MILFFTLIGLGWIITSLILNILETVLIWIYPKANNIHYILLTFFVGFFVTLLSNIFLFSLENNTFSFVHNSGVPDDNLPKGISPFEVKLSNSTLGETIFDMRNVTDTFILGVIGKTVVSAMGKASSIPGKMALGATAAVSLGSVAGAFKYLNSYKKNTSSSSGTTPPITEDNFSIRSSLEPHTFENIGGLLNMVSILLGLALLLFVIFILLLMLERNLSSLDFKSIFITKNVSQENIDWFISKIKSFLTKNLRFYLISLTTLIVFNLSFSLYFIVDVAEFISRIQIC